MDLRDWIGQIKNLGKLKVIEGAHWDLEIGGITEIMVKRKGSPTVLFDRIPGYLPGYRVLGNVIALASEDPVRLSLTLNLPRIESTSELIYVVKQEMQKWEATAKDYPPELVADGPVLEEIHSGEDVDVLKFPAPRWHEKDGGRYIGTGCGVITKDPDTGEVNVGTYRVMVHDRRTVGLYMAPIRHGYSDIRKYHARGEAAPVAITLGHHPVFVLVAGQQIPRGIASAHEYAYIGAIQGRRLPVIKGEVTGLPIPAESEIVLEGWCRPGDEKVEGPFGEFTGYYGGGTEPAPCMVVERVYCRKDPIIIGCPPGKMCGFGTLVFRSAQWLHQLEFLGIPGVKMVVAHPLARSQLVVACIEQRFAGHAREVGHIVAHLTKEVGRFVIVVDEDIDPFDFEDVTWAMATRCDPFEDIDTVRKAFSQRLDPLIPQGTPYERLYNNRAIIDACIPFERRKTFAPVASLSRELRGQIIAKWGDKLGIPLGS